MTDIGAEPRALTEPYTDFLGLTISHVGAAADMLGRAFQDDPLYTYFFPDPGIRRRVLPLIYRAIVELNIAASGVYATSEKLEGIFWATSPGGRKRTPAFQLAVLRAVGGVLCILGHVPFADTMRRFKSFSRAMSALGPRAAPHSGCIRLNTVAVDQRYRGQGHMSRMVSAVIAEADRGQACCLLDTENAANVALYEHFGFTKAESVEVVPGELTVYLMEYDPSAAHEP